MSPGILCAFSKTTNARSAPAEELEKEKRVHHSNCPRTKCIIDFAKPRIILVFELFISIGRIDPEDHVVAGGDLIERRRCAVDLRGAELAFGETGELVTGEVRICCHGG